MTQRIWEMELSWAHRFLDRNGQRTIPLDAPLEEGGKPVVDFWWSLHPDEDPITEKINTQFFPPWIQNDIYDKPDWLRLQTETDIQVNFAWLKVFDTTPGETVDVTAVTSAIGPEGKRVKRKIVVDLTGDTNPTDLSLPASAFVTELDTDETSHLAITAQGPRTAIMVYCQYRIEAEITTDLKSFRVEITPVNAPPPPPDERTVTVIIGVNHRAQATINSQLLGSFAPGAKPVVIGDVVNGYIREKYYGVWILAANLQGV